jgi:putative sigma-54 modulation protein
VRGNSLHAEAVDADMYAAIDELADKLDRQVLRHKDRVKGHVRAPLKTLPSEPATLE